MASPQLENGYTKIANEILDALIKWRLSPYESSILLVVLRKTYGFNKKEDWISLSQFVKATGIKKPHVCRALRMLIKQKMITKGGTPKKPLYKFQKNFDIWAQLPKGARSHHVTKGGNATLPKGVIQSLPKGAHTKETTITKETITLATTVAPVISRPSVVPVRKDEHIIKIMDAFKETGLNPIQSYGNKTQRKACDQLVSAYGLDGTLKLVAGASEARKANDGGDRFAPLIKNPYDLASKAPSLISWGKKNKPASATISQTQKMIKNNLDKYGK